MAEPSAMIMIEKSLYMGRQSHKTPSYRMFDVWLTPVQHKRSSRRKVPGFSGRSLACTRKVL